MSWRCVTLVACLAFAGCRSEYGLSDTRCKDVMAKDAMMFRICESATAVTVRHLGPATAEQLRQRYALRREAQSQGLSILIQNANGGAGRR